ncbi:MAG: 16S rRNA (cytidine(1402)-2'-O)-methyltransferase [Idiomarina sp.]|nr:16S rRNA (cytidine(1402)-2'-O)-methyltransferase [Idiomarina sp.]
MNTGILYIVPTPIGHLGDITVRAQQVLAEVDVVAAEDTRHSRVLMDHLGINTPLMAIHEHNERQKAEGLVTQLLAGKKIALISDAGTPLISDPGFPLVRACRQAGVQVVALPGACAAITALSASGLPTDRFVFCGFLPAKEQARETALEDCVSERGTLVFYEAPRRILSTLKAVMKIFGKECEVVMAREITKQFETYLTGPVAEVLAQVEADSNQQRGEIVLLIAGAPAATDAIPHEASQLLSRLTTELPPKKAAKIVAEHYQLRANDLYKAYLATQQQS